MASVALVSPRIPSPKSAISRTPAWGVVEKGDERRHTLRVAESAEVGGRGHTASMIEALEFFSKERNDRLTQAVELVAQPSVDLLTFAALDLGEEVFSNLPYVFHMVFLAALLWSEGLRALRGETDRL